jgi:hypothetical protein
MRKPRWSELRNSNIGVMRTLEAKDVPVDLKAVDGGYLCPGVKCDVHLYQSYSGTLAKPKPSGLSWEVQVPPSQLLMEQWQKDFRVSIHFGTHVCTGDGTFTFEEDGKVSLTGTELNGLYEAGLCVPEAQKQLA